MASSSASPLGRAVSAFPRLEVSIAGRQHFQALEIYVFSNMGYLLAVSLALFGYGLHGIKARHLDRPVRMPAFFSPLALLVSVFFFVTWGFGGFYAADYVIGTGKRWLFVLGLVLLSLYAPLAMWRRRQDARLAAADPVHTAPLDVAPIATEQRNPLLDEQMAAMRFDQRAADDLLGREVAAGDVEATG